jgi:two-component system chemotaxis response regulator CheB
VVDDSATVRQILAHLLGGAGMDVRTAPDPLFARDKLRRFDADVV